MIICCPQAQREIFSHLYIDLHLYLYNCILFYVFSCFYWGRAKFNKFDCILALFMFICLCKFEIIQHSLNYKCIYICIFSYNTYSGTEYSVYLSIIPECYIVYLVDFLISTSPRGVFRPLRGWYIICPTNRGIPSKSFIFGLNVQ